MAVLSIVFKGDDQVAGATKQVADDLRDVGKAADEAAPKGSGFFGNMMSAASGFLAADLIANIASQFKDFIGGGIADAQASQVLMASTEQTIVTMGNAAGRSAEEIGDLASNLSDASGQSLFGDDQIQESENLLLTFGEIRGEIFDTATALTVDLAAALGGAPADQAMMLGKALNDPIKGISALGKAGLTFSEEQKVMIKAMQESGNMAGAQAIITAELTKQVGGQAAAQAAAAGGMVQFKARMGEVGETIGAALLPALNQAAGMLTESVAPAIEDAANWLGVVLPIAIEKVSGFWNDVLQPALARVWSFLQNNVIPIISELVSWFATELPPAIAQLADYWNTVLLPALSKIWAFIQDNVIPIIDTLIKVAFAVLKEDIKILSAIWVNVLWPALQKVWAFIAENVIPILDDLIVWIKDNLPPTIKALADLWNNTLLPALTATWKFIDTKVLPILAAIGEVVNAVLTLAFKVLVGTITTTVIPALEKLWGYIDKNIMPIFKTIGEFIQATTAPAFAYLGKQIGPIVDFMADLLDNIQGVVDWLGQLAEKIRSIDIPSWAGGGGGGGGGGDEGGEAPASMGMRLAGALRGSPRGAGTSALGQSSASVQTIHITIDDRGAEWLMKLIDIRIDERTRRASGMARGGGYN